MSERLLVATRKGLLTLRRQGSWRITGTAFMGDPVSMVLHDLRSDALYAALNLGHFGVKLHRSRDGGASFEALREGLPQEHAYHLVYRHALDVDASGEMLAMGSTTGGLWLSENGGEAWQTLALHLPPVYALRFA